MGMLDTDKVLAASRGTPAQAIAALNGPDDTDRQFVTALYRWATVAGVDAAVAVAQAYHETANLTSVRWLNDRNPAGIGIPADDTPQPFTVPDGEAAARLQIQCLYSLVERRLHHDIPLWPAAERWMRDVWLDLHVLDPNCPAVHSIGDLNQRYKDRTGDMQATWAWDAAYHALLVAKGNAVFPNLSATLHEEDNPMAKPSILVVAGHRSHGDAGNQDEEALTPAMAIAYRDALRSAGYRVETIPAQPDGPELDGGLDTVGQLTHDWMARTPGSKLMLDCHYGGEPVGGCFVIVPDKGGLGTAIQIVQLPHDTWENNALDRELAREIVNRMAGQTGMPQRTAGVRERGIMSETQTGVAGQFDARLAMFAYTSPFVDDAVRLVVEHGNLNPNAPNERAIIFRDDFTDKCAAAVAAAVNHVYGEVDEEEEEEPGVVRPITFPWLTDPAELAKGIDRKIKNTRVFAFRRVWTAVRETPRLQHAGKGAPEIGPKIAKGEQFVGEFVYRSGGQWWVLTQSGTRVRVADLDLQVELIAA